MKEKESTDDMLPVTVVSILLILLASVAAVFLIREYSPHQCCSFDADLKSMLNDCSLLQGRKKEEPANL